MTAADVQPEPSLTADAELAGILAQLGTIADRLGTRAVTAHYEADISDPMQTRKGTAFQASSGPLPRFLPVRDILRINFNMHALVPAEAVPRRLARSMRIPIDDNLATTIPYAPTLRDALQLVARYGDAVVPWYARSVIERAGSLCVTYGPIVRLGRIESLATEIALATIHRIVETFAGDRIAAARVNFARLPVSSPIALSDRFACPVTIGGSESFMAFPADWGALPSPYHDPILWRDGVARCNADILAVTDSPLVNRVRAHVRHGLDARRVETVADTARALGTSSRSPVRAMAQHGVTHHQIVDAERQQRARLLLAQPIMPIADIADALGFADQSSFGRKCRVWFATSPARIRQQLVTAGGG